MGNFRMKTAGIIGIRGFYSLVYGFGLYGASLIGCIIAAIVSGTYMETIQENGFLIISNPLNPPFNLVITISGAFLALSAVMSISREYESGTLEVLFYGPVDAVSYILGKYLEQIMAFTLMLLLYVLVFFGFGQITNFGFSFEMVFNILLSLALASGITSFGILLSAVTRKIRTSILLLIVLLCLFLGVQWSESFVSGLDSQSLSPVLSYARSFLALLSGTLGFISPFAYFNRGAEAVAILEMPDFFGNLAALIVYSLVMLVLAVVCFKKKGVRAS